MLFSWNIPPSPSPTESKRLFYKSVSMDRSTKQKINKETQTLNDLVSEFFENAYLPWLRLSLCISLRLWFYSQISFLAFLEIPLTEGFFT